MRLGAGRCTSDGSLLDPLGRGYQPALDPDDVTGAIQAAFAGDPAAPWRLMGSGPRDEDSPVARIGRHLADARAGAKGRGKARGATAAAPRAPRLRTSPARVAAPPAVALDALRRLLAERYLRLLHAPGVLDARLLARHHDIDEEDYDAVTSLLRRLPAAARLRITGRDAEALAVAVHQHRYDAGFDAFRKLLEELAERLPPRSFQALADFVYLHQEGAH